MSKDAVMNGCQHIGQDRVRGFTLVELLVVLAIVGMLASLLLPGLAKAKAVGQRSACQNNLKQLQAGYLMYVDEDNDRLPPNRARAVPGYRENLPGSWVVGNARRDTNTDNIKAGVLFPFVQVAEVYHCPADRAIVPGQSHLLHTRSYSLEMWLNSSKTGDGFAWTPETYRWMQMRLSTVQHPAPSLVFAFIDEHELSIDTGIFIIEEPPVTGHPWYSLPAGRHQQGCNLSFLDGHVEPWSWKAPKISKGFGSPVSSPAEAGDQNRIAAALPQDVLRDGVE